MKPLFPIVVTICLVLASASESPKELAKEPLEADESLPQERKERCSACSQNVKLNLGSAKEILSALQQLPGEVHTQQTFEGCSSEKGCAGIKVKDGQVIQKFGNLDAFNQAVAQDTSNEFTFHAAGSKAFDSNGPFWWMNQNSPFKNNGAFEKFSKTSSSYTSSGSGVDLSGNPFLNGGLSKGFGADKSSFQSFESSYASKGDVDLSKNPFLSGIKGSASQFSGSQSFGTQGYVGSSPTPFVASSGSSLEAGFQSGGSVGDQDLSQACTGQGYVCVPRAQCSNGVVSGALQAISQKQFCNSRSEVCCRIESSESYFGSASQTFGSSQSFGSGFGSSSGSGFGANSFGSSSSGYGSNVGSTLAPSSSQSNFIDSESFGSSNQNAFRPGATGLKPGIPYLPPVDSSNSPSNVVPSTVYPTSFVTTPRPLSTPRPFTTVKPTYLPPVSSTSAPGYLPPVAESSIPREVVVPPYTDGSLILDVNRQPSPRPSRPFTPGPSPSEIPAGCAAALKCTPVEFCTAEGVISNTSVILTREQESYRVPLTDCKDLETGRVGKCCRDPYYTDPWPTNQIGRWVPGVFGGNDGKYVPDNRGSIPTNDRLQSTARPPTTGSVLFNIYRTSPKPTGPTFVPGRTPGFPTTTVSPTPFTQGQYGSQGIGQIGVGGVGQIGQGERGQYQIQGFGQNITQGNGAYIQQGGGQIQNGNGFGVSQGSGVGINQGFGVGVTGGQGQKETQGFGSAYDQGFEQSVNQGVQTSQGVRVETGNGFGVNQGSGIGVSQGFGTGVKYGVGQKLVSGSGQTVIPGERKDVIEGGGSGIKTGGGFTVSQGSGQGVIQSGGIGIKNGGGYIVKQGEGQGVIQGSGIGIKNGGGYTVSQSEGQGIIQGGGIGIKNGGGFTVSQGSGQGVIQGGGIGIKNGGGYIVKQGEGQGIIQGGGIGIKNGGGFTVSQGSGQGVIQGGGIGIKNGGGYIVRQGEGQGVIQGGGYGIKNGGGYTVSQAGGYGVENEYRESVRRVFLQRYNGNGQCGLLNPQKPYGNRNELEVDFAEIPWQAMVLLQTNKSLLCGGVITRPEVVLTSASCVEGLEAKNVLIKGGEWKLGIDDEPLPFQIVQVKTIIRHPEYRRGSLKDDVAILILNENLRLAKNIQPICLPSSTDSLDAFYNGVGECIVTGWGKSVLQAHLSGSIMHSLNVSLINPGECQAKLSSDYPHLLEQYDQDSCVCGEPSNPLNNICRVDIGSALACTSGDSHFVLRGIYSWDSGCQTGNQIAGFYKFDLEWYEWAIGLIESVRFAKYTKITQGKVTQISSTKTTQYTGVKSSGVKEVSSGTGSNYGQFSIVGGSNQFGQGQDQFGQGQSQFGLGQGQFGQGQGQFGQSQTSQFGQGQTSQFGQGQTSQFGQGQTSQIGAGQIGGKFTEGGLSYSSEIKSPVTKTFTTTYTSNSQFGKGPAGNGDSNGFGQLAQVAGGAKQFGQFGSFTTGKGQIVNSDVSKGFGQFSQVGSGQSQLGLNFGTDIKPITNTFSATYSEKKVFQSEPKIVTYTTKPEIVTFTTKPEIVTFTTKPEYFTYTTKPEIVTFTTKPEYFTFTTKPKLVTYTTKPQYITYQTSDTIASPQVVAPEVSFNPSFTEVVGKHKHNGHCKCSEGKK